MHYCLKWLTNSKRHETEVIKLFKQYLVVTLLFEQNERRNEGDSKRLKAVGELKVEVEGKGAAVERRSKLEELPKQDYIHVRARRGQATDSHSLAERVMISLEMLFVFMILFMLFVYNQ